MIWKYLKSDKYPSIVLIFAMAPKFSYFVLTSRLAFIALLSFSVAVQGHQLTSGRYFVYCHS